MCWDFIFEVSFDSQPSNSGRSAELLGTSINPFVGFSAVKESSSTSNAPGFAFNVSSFEDGDSNLDVKFQLVLKKMNKKDGTTKLKVGVNGNYYINILLESICTSWIKLEWLTFWLNIWFIFRHCKSLLNLWK